MNPLVSILVPVYNTEHYLPRCLDTIVNQTYRSLQVVVVDDGSRDGSLEVARQYAEQYSFVEVLHQDNAGVAAARNNLLAHMQGDYVIFVDSDDWIEPDMVEFLVDKVNESGADVVTCGMVVGEKEVTTDYTETLWDREETVRRFLFHNELSGSLWNKLVKTSLLHNLQFDTRVSYGEDALFTWHYLQRINSLLFTTRRLYHYRRNFQSISHQAWLPNKQGSDHIVWSAITADTATLWPQYLYIAQARYAIQDMWAIWRAALTDYKRDEHIRIRQQNIRSHLQAIRRSHLLDLPHLILTFIIAYSYTFAKPIVKAKYRSK